MKKICRMMSVFATTFLGVALGVALGIALSGAPAFCATYTIVDLGGYTPKDINKYGDVVLNTSNYSYLYSKGIITSIIGSSGTKAEAINDKGQIVGQTGGKAFIYDGLSTTILPTLGGSYSKAYGINNFGEVVGASEIAGGQMRAFLYSNGAMRDLGTIPGGSSYKASDINDSGWVTGDFQIGSNHHVFLYSSNYGMMDISSEGGLGGNLSYAFSINNDSPGSPGQVVGYATHSDNYYAHGFIAEQWYWEDLGTLAGENLRIASIATDINNLGQVVGTSGKVQGQNTMYAFLYNNEIMIDLNTLIDPASGWSLRGAEAINDKGQIVGVGKFNGYDRAFLLSPVPVPVPSAAWLLGTGLFGLLGIRHRKNS